MEILSDIIKEHLIKEIKFSASRSTGPGGQHVNKVNTKVELRFKIMLSDSLNSFQKNRISEKLKSRINKEGELVLVNQESKSQTRNKELVIIRFFNLLCDALKPSKKRKPTHPTRSSVQKRLDSKKHLSNIKKNRKKIRG